MTVQADLETALEQIAARILEITESPKPSYSVDGQSVSWDAYLRTLIDSYERLKKQIQSEEPFEVQSTGYN